MLDAFEEFNQYRSIGTVEECRVAVEKQKMKKPFKTPDGNMNCYVCEEVVKYPEQYCQNCGQAIDWRDVL